MIDVLPKNIFQNLINFPQLYTLILWNRILYQNMIKHRTKNTLILYFLIFFSTASKNIQVLIMASTTTLGISNQSKFYTKLVLTVLKSPTLVNKISGTNWQMEADGII